ncbi:MAG TPA: CooT family nickel-binding protein [Desulfocapsa sulfexigens]|nr:CooT family nickel-binding protein [Desulfocapsa sulfexigens]
MCQMSVLVLEDTNEELVMESVTRLEVKDNGVAVSTFFEETKFVPEVRVQEIDFLGGKVFLERTVKA